MSVESEMSMQCELGSRQKSRPSVFPAVGLMLSFYSLLLETGQIWGLGGAVVGWW